MEQFKGVCNTVYDTVFELAQKGLHGIIFLGVITLLFIAFFVYFNHIENTRKSRTSHSQSPTKQQGSTRSKTTTPRKRTKKSTTEEVNP